jgi:hypothetical protein
MAKPIILIGLAGQVPPPELHAISDQISEKCTDYHVLVYADSNITSLDFRVFYEKDFEQVNYDELKKIVETAVKHE